MWILQNIYLDLVLLLVCHARYFEEGYSHHYAYTAESDYLGMENVTTTVKFRVVPVNSSYHGSFLSLEIDTITQYAKDGFLVENPSKWDLDKRFLFRMANDGEVLMVHFHPDDPDEAVLLKKALASTFSAKVKEMILSCSLYYEYHIRGKCLNMKSSLDSKKDSWKYTTTEKDHLGELDHEYTAVRHSEGLQLHRYHRSLDRVERIHRKTLHYNFDNTIHKIQAEDHIILENRFPEYEKREPMPGEYVIKDSTEGEVKRIHAKAFVNMKLTNKIRYGINNYHEHDGILQEEDLVFKKKTVKSDISDISNDIKTALACIHSYIDKSDINRTRCVNTLRDKLVSLKEEQYIHFVDDVMGRQCDNNDTVCLDERHLIIDIVSRQGDQLSQQLILTHLFHTDTEDEEGLRRALIHFSTLEHPLSVTLLAVENLCLGHNDSNHGKLNISQTHRRACLTLGALVNKVSSKNTTEADRILSKLHTWLSEQDNVLYRRRRQVDTSQDEISDDHKMTKFVLIHSLGNAGLPQSLPHIIKYLKPNKRESEWRRAAISATRKYECHKTADALVRSMHYDRSESVRRMALSRYIQHPKRLNISKQLENEILSKNYTYPMVARVKRWGVLDKPLIEFKIELPEFHWHKQIGSSAVGASFGIDFVNRLHLRIMPLSGFLHINVHDKAFAEAHIGIINYKVEIFYIEACYIGHVDYNLNIMKDFTYGIANKLMKSMDDMASTMISPLVECVQRMSDTFTSSHTRTGGGIFTVLGNSIQGIPGHADSIVNSSVALVSSLEKINGFPWIQTLKLSATWMQSFSEDIRDDATVFYNKIADACLIVLPFAEKSMVEALNMIIESQKKIAEHPRSAFSTIDQAKAKMKLAMTRIIEGKNRVIEALSSGGVPPIWLNSIGQIRDLRLTLQNLLPKIAVPSVENYTETTKSRSQDLEAIQTVRNNIQSAVQQLRQLESISKTFLQALKQSMENLKVLKTQYERTEEVTNEVKANMELVFGPKFHKAFPGGRRICDESCGCGKWPATTGSIYKDMPGVDLVAHHGREVVMPANGLIRKGNDTDTLYIRLTDQTLGMYELVISNIDPNEKINDTEGFVRAGIIIGTGSGHRKCKDDFIHIAMRKRASQKKDCYQYVDPSRYIDHIDLVPKWIQDCKEFTFRHIGNIIDSGMSGKGFLKTLKKFAKRALEWAVANGTKLLEKIFPDSPIIGKIGKIIDAFMSVVDAAKDLTNLFSNMDGGFSDFQSSMKTMSSISKDIGNMAGNVGDFLGAVGVSSNITNAFHLANTVTDGLSAGFDIAGDVGETIDNMGNSADFQSTMGGLSNLTASVGDAAHDIAGVLQSFGVDSEAVNALDAIHSATGTISGMLDTAGSIGNELAGADHSTVSGVMNGISAITTGIGKTAGQMGNLLQHLGVSEDAVKVFSQIQNGASGISGIMQTLGSATKQIQDQAKHIQSGIEIGHTMSSIASAVGDTAGDISSFLSSVGVKGDAINVLNDIHVAAEGTANIITQVNSVAENMKHNEENPTSATNAFTAVSQISSAVGNTAGELSNMLSDLGIHGEGVDILNKVQGGANGVSEIMNAVDTAAKELTKDVENGPSGTFNGISHIASGVGDTAAAVNHLLQNVGVKGDAVNILSQVEAGAHGAAGVIDTVGQTAEQLANGIHNAKGPSGVIDGVSGLASGVGDTAAAVNHLLQNVGVKGDAVNILSQVEAGAHGAAGVIDTVGQTAEQLANGIHNAKGPSGVIDGVSGLASGVGDTAAAVNHLLQNVGVKGDAVNILSQVEAGAHGAAGVIDTVGQTAEQLANGIHNAKGPSGVIDGVSGLASGVGDTAAAVNHLLQNVGVKGDAVNILSQVEAGAHGAAGVIDTVGQTAEQLANGIHNAKGPSGVIDGVSGLASGVGDTAAAVNHLLQNVGVKGDAVNILSQVEAGAHGAAGVIDTVGQTAEQLANGIHNAKGPSGVIDGVSGLASGVGDTAAAVNHLLQNVGVKGDAVNILSQVEAGAHGAAGVIDTVGQTAEQLANGIHNAKGPSGVIDGVSGLASGVGDTAAAVNHLLQNVGVKGEAVNILSQVEAGAHGAAGVIDTVGQTAEQLANGIHNAKGPSGVIDGVSGLASGVGDTAAAVNHLLQNVGVKGDAVNILSQVEAGAHGAAGVIDTVGQTAEQLANGIHNAKGPSGVIDGVSGLASGVGDTAAAVNHLLQNVGVKGDAVNILSQVEAGAHGAAGVIDTVGQTAEQLANGIHNAKGPSGVIDGVSGLASGVGDTAAAVNHLLQNVGVKGDAVNILSQVEAGAHGAAGVIDTVGQTAEQLANGIHNAKGPSGVIDGVSGLASGVGDTAAAVNHLLQNVGVKGDAVNILSQVEAGAHGAAGVIDTVGQTAEQLANGIHNAKGPSGAIDGVSGLASGVGDTAAAVNHLLQNVGVKGDAVNILSQVEAGAHGAAGVIDTVGQTAEQLANGIHNAKGPSGVIDGVSGLASGVGDTAAAVNHLLQNVGVKGDAVNILSQVEAGAHGAAGVIDTVGQTAEQLANGIHNAKGPSGVIDGVSGLASGVGDTAAAVNHLLQNVGVKGDAVNILSQVEAGAHGAAGVIDTVGQTAEQLANGIHNAKGPSGVIDGVSGLASGVGDTAAAVNHLLQNVGVKGDAVNILSQVEAGAHGAAGVIDTVGQTAEQLANGIHNAKGPSGAIDGVSGLASGVGDTAAAVNHLLQNVGVKGDAVNILSQVEAGAHGAAGVIDTVGQTAEQLANGIHNAKGPSGVIDGVSGLASGVGDTAAAVNHLLQNVGVKGDAVNILSQVEAGAHGAAGVIDTVGQTAEQLANGIHNAKGPSGVIDGVSGLASGVGDTAAAVNHLLQNVGVKGDAVNILSQVEAGAHGAAGVIDTVGQTAEQLANGIHNAKGPSGVIDGVSGLASGVGDTAAAVNHLLQNVGVKGDAVNILSQVEAGAHGAAGVIDTVGQTAEQLANGIHNAKGPSGVIDGVSGLASGVGDTAAAVNHLLQNVGVKGDAVNILSQVEAGAHGAAGVIDTVGQTAEQLANGIHNAKGPSGVIDGVSGLASGVGDTAAAVNHLLQNVGVKGDAVNILSQVEADAHGAAGVIDTVGQTAEQLANGIHNAKGPSGVIDGVSGLASGVGDTAAAVNHLLQNVGVKGDAVNILSQVEAGAHGAAGVIDTVGQTAEQLANGIHNAKVPSGVIDGVSGLASGVGDTAAAVNHLLQNVGVKGDAVNILSQVEAGAHGAAGVIDTVGQTAEQLANGIHNAKGPSGVIDGVSGLASGVGDTAAAVNHLLQNVGVKGDAVNILSQVEADAHGAAGVIDTVGQTAEQLANGIHNAKGPSGVIDGVSGLASGVGDTAAAVNHLLQNVGVKGDAVNILSQVEAGAHGAAGVIDTVGQTAEQLANGIHNAKGPSGVIDGVSGLASGVGDTAAAVNHLLQNVGVKGDAVNILSQVEAGAHGAAGVIDTVDQTAEYLSSQNRNSIVDRSKRSIPKLLENLSYISTNLGNAVQQLSDIILKSNISDDVKYTLNQIQNGSNLILKVIHSPVSSDEPEAENNAKAQFFADSQNINKNVDLLAIQLSSLQSKFPGLLHTLKGIGNIANGLQSTLPGLENIISDFARSGDASGLLSNIESGSHGIYGALDRLTERNQPIEAMHNENTLASSTYESVRSKRSSTTPDDILSDIEEHKKMGFIVRRNAAVLGGNLLSQFSKRKRSLPQDTKQISSHNYTQNVSADTQQTNINAGQRLLRDVDVGAMVVSEWLEALETSDDSVRRRLPEIRRLVTVLVNDSSTLSLTGLMSIASQTLQDFLEKYNIPANGDKSSMLAMLQTLPEGVCPEFGTGIVESFGHVCIPDDDCLGLTCRVSFSSGMSVKNLIVAVHVNPGTKHLTIRCLGKVKDILLSNKTVDSKLAVPLFSGFTADIITQTTLALDNTTTIVSLQVEACSHNLMSCLPTTPVLRNMIFHLRRKRSVLGMLKSMISADDVQSMPVNSFIANLARRNLPTEPIVFAANAVRGGLKDVLSATENHDVEKSQKEFAETKDSHDVGDDPEKMIDLILFKISHTFGVGPIGIKLEFGAGGAIGMSIAVDVRIMSGTSKFVIAPWVAGEVYGGVSIELLIASGGLKLIGYILKTKFPITTETKQAKAPVEVIQKLDLELIPLELQLRGWAKLFGGVVFDKCLWKWSAPSIKWNIFTHKRTGHTEHAPKFQISNACLTKQSPHTGTGCSISQLKGRHPTDTAFHLEVFADDDASDVEQSYAIGDHDGGSNVWGWKTFKGSSLVEPTTSLPNGIPLYWTVKAKNTDGLESVTKCHISTFDNTEPDGRVEASFRFSSHPHVLSASIIVIDDSELLENTVVAIGYSPGIYGTEVVSWQPLRLTLSSGRTGIQGNLKYFSEPRKGRLSSNGMKALTVKFPEDCASHCIAFGKKCISFDFEFHKQTCVLQDVIEGPFAQIHQSGSYKNYERLDVGFSAYVEYKTLPLSHGAMYFINVVVTNQLGYRSVLSSEGTMVDFTPPMTGYLGHIVYYDNITTDGCHAAITQRCTNTTWYKNHRRIIDGPGSRTVFNGHKPLQEERYTISNNFMSVNFDGFKDMESGIWGYTWAAGTKPCATDIVSYNDPHATLTDPKFWTFTGFAKDMKLEDGKYYVTVQALNQVVYGGSLVTTVCHSTPLIVDTTPPIFHEVTDVMFDEDFDILVVYYNVSDPGSRIARVDFGLGKSKHDVDIRGYDRKEYMERYDPYFVIEHLDLQPGVPAWIRVRAVNNVNLFAAGHAPQPIMVDKTAPVVGTVYDGDRLDTDLQYQHETDKICAQWEKFFDPESGIKEFVWGVGTQPQSDNIVKYHNMSHHTRQTCAEAKLQHNLTYYSTVIAYNDAINSKKANASSDGVLVDVTKPLPGYVNDGLSLKIDKDFSSEEATVKTIWDDYSDPESGIFSYKLDVYVNHEHRRTFTLGKDTSLIDHSMIFNHLDEVYSEVEATNGAGLTVTVESDGFLVDLTPPITRFISDSTSSTGFQSDNSLLVLSWGFYDTESGVAEYRYRVNELRGGQKRKVWPVAEPFESVSKIEMEGVQNVEVHLEMNEGSKYFAHVTAINGADLSTSHESVGVTIDTSPPVLSEVLIGQPGEDENIHPSEGYVVLETPDTMTIHWVVMDPESGIENIHIAIGTSSGNYDIKSWFVIPGNKEFTSIEDLGLTPTKTSNVFYFVSVKAENKAGLSSNIVMSKRIYVQKANVPGVVYDGRTLLEDEEYQHDKTSIVMSFSGFESESCNIIGYEWAIGSKPFFSDVLPFTEYGIVLHNSSFGHAQIHHDLYESEKYFSTVRARTGYKCRSSYIVSSSNGITLDTQPPKHKFLVSNTTIYSSNPDSYKNSFQDSTDSVNLEWNVTDNSGLRNIMVELGSLPDNADVYNSSEIKSSRLPPGMLKLSSGETFFVTLQTEDNSGIKGAVVSPSITVDISPPSIANFHCTPYISVTKTLVECEWNMIKEFESILTSVEIGISTHQMSFDVLEFTRVAAGRRNWARDLHSVLRSSDTENIFFTVRLTNILEHTHMLDYKVIVDRTPPLKGKVFITTVSDDDEPKEQLCQIPQHFVEVNIEDFTDPESDIARVEVGLGSKSGLTDILGYMASQSTRHHILTNVDLEVGQRIFASVRVFNKAGLFTPAVSNPVVISPNPKLEVYDGKSPNQDEDYQSDISKLQGHWHYSDPCPILHAEWAVEDLTGENVIAFTTIGGNADHFYNDELQLTNGFTYFSIIRVTDALNRTQTARSDGMTVRIQPPSPGSVRDGLENDDINFQSSVTELSANWKSFGKDNSKDPTQIIVRYEVAIGNDRRFERTRSNIHFFVNVGMNKSHIFRNLNLTAKIVPYYVTVKAFSKAGSIQEVTSNGVRVGFSEEIVAGYIKYATAQSVTDVVKVSWGGFQADLGIRRYDVAISTAKPFHYNHSINCDIMQIDQDMFDVMKPKSFGLDTMVYVQGLSLHHGGHYFVTVIARSESGICLPVTGERMVVDKTPPIPNSMYIENQQVSDILFVQDSNKLTLHWKPAIDQESGIQSYNITLFSKYTCSKENGQSSKIVLRNIYLRNETSYIFYELALHSNTPYFISVEITNNAGLHSLHTTYPVFVDETRPTPGVVKSGSIWKKSRPIQNSTHELHGMIAIARTKRSHDCPKTKEVPSNLWHSMERNFNKECSYVDGENVYVEVRHNDPQQYIIKGGMEIGSTEIKEGQYTFDMKSASGNQIITNWAIASNSALVPRSFDKLKSVTYLKENSSSVQYSENDTTMGNINDFGLGILVLGYQENGQYQVIFWVNDPYNVKSKWQVVDKNPSDDWNKYSVSLFEDKTPEMTYWNVEFALNEIVIVRFNSLTFQKSANVYFFGLNIDGYNPPIIDHFHPFYSRAEMRNFMVPVDLSEECMYGQGFYDGESFIRDIQVAISSNVTEEENIIPFKLLKTYCFPCQSICPSYCYSSCAESKIFSEFEIVPVDFYNLTLNAASYIPSLNESSSNVTSNSTFQNFDVPSYFINVKISNFARAEVTFRSEAITIDTTPPRCLKMFCVDPEHSMEEPSRYQKSTTAVGAFWECEEDVSDIVYYTVYVGSAAGIQDILSTRNIGLTTSVKLGIKEGLLNDSNTYYITVNAWNSAARFSSISCTITIETSKPDVSTMNTAPMFAKSLPDGPSDISFSERGDAVGVSWQAASHNTDYYEMQIGTRKGLDDIFPRVKVGNNASKAIAIVSGEIWLDGMQTGKSIAEFLLRNWTDENMEAAKHNTFFNMEPGRCMYISLFALSRSHVLSEIPLQPECFKRKDDIVLNFHQKETHVLTQNGPKFVLDNPSNTDDKVRIRIEGEHGGITAGFLDQSDLGADYGTAANGNYKSFLSSPETTLSATSRTLKHRMQSYQGSSFYISPSGNATLTNWINVELQYDKANVLGNDSVPAIVYWDTDAGLWRHVTEDCSKTFTIDRQKSVINAQVCLQEKSHPGTREKREDSDVHIVSDPRQFALVTITKNIVNNQPKLASKLVNIQEDTTRCVDLEWVDEDGDTIVFSVQHGPYHGDANVTTAGYFCYHPYKNFNGWDNITLQMTEVISSKMPISPSIVEVVVKLLVIQNNDGPTMYYGTSTNTTYDTRVNNVVDVLFEANQSSSYFVGAYLAVDPDLQDSLEYDKVDPSLAGVNFTLTETAETSEFLKNKAQYSLTNNIVSRSFSLSVDLSTFAYGVADYGLLVYDRDGYYCKPAWFKVYILLNPCVHGHCDPKSNIPCNDTSRAQSFSDFVCTCDPGYQGEWCEVETDECRTHPCPLMYDCHDEIAKFTCHINIAKLMAILMCIAVPTAVIIVVLYRRLSKKRSSKVSDSWQFLSEENNEAKVLDQENEEKKAIQNQDDRKSEEEDEQEDEETSSENEQKEEEVEKEDDVNQINKYGSKRAVDADIDDSLLKQFQSRLDKTLPPHHVAQLRSMKTIPDKRGKIKESRHIKPASRYVREEAWN